LTTPTAFQRKVADAITATGDVDLVIGHHAHVLQPIEQVEGHWVVFGLGNVLSNMPAGPDWPASSEDAAVVTVKVDEVAQGQFVVERPVVWPTFVVRGSFSIVDVQHTLANGGGGALRPVLIASLRRTERVLGPFVATA
jgi:poly-gamma-glutamate synthesis protein (capsule biosynthesis protein)